jgi:hypothetical protein
MLGCEEKIELLAIENCPVIDCRSSVCSLEDIG